MPWSEATQPPPTPETARVRNPEGRQSLGRRQCTGTTRAGTRCGRPPHRGGTCCILHGGASPLAKHAAQRMLLSLVEPAAALLMLAVTRCEFEWVVPDDENGNPMPAARFKRCAVHEEDGCPEWPVRVTAAKTLLSRAGYGEQAKMTIETNSTDLDKLDNTSLANELEKLSRDLRDNSRAPINVTPTPEIQEAEIVPQDSSDVHNVINVPDEAPYTDSRRTSGIEAPSNS